MEDTRENRSIDELNMVKENLSESNKQILNKNINRDSNHADHIIPQWIKENEILLHNINSISTDQSAIVILRHSHRTEITKIEESIGALLTDIGKQRAKEFGQRLNKGRNYRIFSSKIERCLQTAECVAEGIRTHTPFDHKITEMSVLSEIAGDGYQIVSELMKDHRNFILRWACNHFSPAMIEPISSYSARSANVIFREHLKKQEPTVDIFVTHDLNLMALQMAWTGKFKQDEWVEYLGGFILIINNTNWSIIKENKRWNIPFPYWWPFKPLTSEN